MKLAFPLLLVLFVSDHVVMESADESVGNEAWPVPLRETPPGFDEVQFPSEWPPLPAEERVAEILQAQPDKELIETIKSLPADSVWYDGTFVGLLQRMSPAAEAVAKDTRPVVDRSLIAMLDDPATELHTFRVVHHLLTSRYASPMYLVKNPAATSRVTRLSKQPRPTEADRQALRAYWHLQLGQNEYLPDIVDVLNENAFSFKRNPLSGRYVARAENLGALFLLRTDPWEAYFLLQPLLDDENRFAVAHVLLGLKVMQVTTTDAERRYLDMPLRRVSDWDDEREPDEMTADPIGFNAVRDWWARRRLLATDDFQEYDELGQEAAEEWSKRRAASQKDFGR